MPSHHCDGECWRQIPYATRYSVSCLGRVRRDSTGRILCFYSKAPRGYRVVKLGGGGGRDCGNYYIHRLVYEAFVGSVDPGMHVRHLNSTPSDNRLDNLRAGTVRENWGDRLGNGTHGYKLSEAQARSILELRAAGFTQASIGARFGVTRTAVRQICLGRNWSFLQPTPQEP